MDMEMLSEKVKAAGTLSIRMEEVREAYGAGRLGVTVRQNISTKFDGHGIGHYPAELPDNQNDWVRLFHKGSGVADIIQAVLNPSETNDNQLIGAVQSNDRQLLLKIRELVCE